MMRSIALVVALLFVTACVQTTTPQQTAQLKSLTVVTGFGEQIEIKFSGLSSFSTLDKTAKVDWQIDAYFKQLAASLLNPRYQLRPIAYDPVNLLQSKNTFGDPAGEAVKSVVQPGTVDAILYFGPWGSPEAADRNFGVGLGFLGHSSLTSSDDLAFAGWQALLIDGKSMTVLGRAAALLPRQIDLLYLAPRARTPRVSTGFKIPARYEEFSPDQRRLGREMIFSLIEKHMPQVLTELNLR
jgi:hypothetical protein